ncbi:MAG: hypothetical protein PHI85_01570 [Victivallaceae bacterium]|nr:hypothetical protein [Victivallaceae bacterium]
MTKIISTELQQEQAGLTENVQITETGAIKFGTLTSPTSSYSASMQFDGDALNLALSGTISTVTTKVNLGVMFGKIATTYTYLDGSVDFGGSGSINVTAKSLGASTTASGFWGKNLTFRNFSAANSIKVSAIAGSTATTQVSAYANATGIYASGTVTFENDFGGELSVTAKGAGSKWGDATSDGIYSLSGLAISGTLSGSITSTATGADSGFSGEAVASGITAGNKSFSALVTIGSLSGSINATADGGKLSGAVTGSANGTAYGVYGSNGVVISSLTGEIRATGNGGNITAATNTAYAQGRAFGIYSNTGDIQISSPEFSAIYATANGGMTALASSDYTTTPCDVSVYAYGICSHANVIVNELNAFITVVASGSAYGSTLYSQYGRGFAEAYGIWADGNITIKSAMTEGFGSIDVTSSAGNSGGWNYTGSVAAGLSASKQIIDSVIFSAITVQSKGIEGRSDAIADGYGVIAREGILNTKFIGAISVTVSGSTASGAPGQAHGYGIYAGNRTFGNAASTASVGDISVTVTGSNGVGGNLPSTAYGIYAGFVNLEINGMISASVNGAEGYAIYIDNPGSYADNLYLRRNANFGAKVELAGGANRIFLFQSASGLDKIQATGGTLDLYFSFGSDIESTAMAEASKLNNFRNIGYYVENTAVSATYTMMTSGYEKYLDSEYSVLLNGITYTAAADIWTQLGTTDKWIKISVGANGFQAAIRVGNEFLGAGINAEGQGYFSPLSETVDSQTLGIVAGFGKLASGSCTMFGDITLSAAGSDIALLYGGNAHAGGSASIYGNISLALDDTKVGSIFGGGIGRNQSIDGAITVSLLNRSGVTAALYGAGAATVGGSASPTEVAISINNSSVAGYLYGGTTSVSLTAGPNNVYGNITLNIAGASTISAQVYAGNRYVSSVSGSSEVSGKTVMNISGGTFSNYVFGGGMAWAAGMSTAVTVESKISGGTELNITGGTFTHEIYGGGYAAANGGTFTGAAGSVSVVSNGSSIKFSNASVINLYGGGYNAGKSSIVDGGAAITVSGIVSIGAIYGGGNGSGSSGVRADSIVNGGAAITVDGSAGGSFTIGNIYGGGNNYCVVNGGSTITFKGDFLNGGGTLNFTGILSGDGRTAGTVKDSRKLSFSEFSGTIDARVMHFDNISVSGASSAAFTREFSAGEIAGLNFDCRTGYGNLMFANTVTGWNDSLTITIRLGAAVESGSFKLIESLESSLDLLTGKNYEIYFGDAVEAAYAGKIGDSGFKYNDFNIGLGIDAGNQLSLGISAAAPAGLDIDADGKSGGLKLLA